MFRKMLHLLSKKGKRDLVLSIFFFTLYGVCSLLMMLTVFKLLLKTIEGEAISQFYPFFIFLGGLVVVKGISNMVADLTKHNVGFDIVQQIREKMILQLKQFTLGFYTNERVGEINTILHRDVDNMSMVVGHVWARMIGDFLIAFILLVGFLFINLEMALLMLISVVIASAFLFLNINRAKKIERQNSDALLDMVSLFVEYVKGIPLLKIFSNNKKIDDRLVETVKRFEQTSQKSSASKAKQLSLFAFLLDSSYCGLLLWGGVKCFYVSLPLFSFVIFALLAKEFYKPFASMEEHYRYYLCAVESYERLKKILFAQGIADEKGGEFPSSNEIAFKQVAFSYGESGFKMEDLNFSIDENKMTALVGSSGSGKTTITHLLLRFYECESGRIEIGGVDIRKIPYDDLLDRISIVMQSVQLFNCSIEENIRIGKKGATKEEIVAACKKARIHEFIESLPEGYETKIIENGSTLSGGQRQRISIARAFLKNAPILILDEMTSNVDPLNEALIQEGLSELVKNRTVVVIAHHLKTVQAADQIVVFKEGKLMEKGRHPELIKRRSYYWKLWNAQYEEGNWS